MKVKVKKLVEAPSNVKEIVKRISSTPIQDLGTVLRGFVWTYEKGDINHWVPVLDHFDAFLEKYVSTRADVQLKLGEEGEVEDSPFPTDDVLAVLRATCSILENCSNKGAYNSSEHLSSLLAAPVLEVSAAALQVLQVLLRKTHHTSVRLAVFPGLTQRLLSLCKGWGGKEEGLDLVVCASADESAVSKVQHKATVLNFEFTPDKEPAEGSAVDVPVQPLALSVPGVDKLTEPEHIILAELVKRYKVPTEARFELLCRIRIARNFGTLAGRRQLIHQRLLAFNVLLQCSPSAEEYNSLYVAEPELVSELVGLVQAEGAVDQEELRTLALRALAAQLQDRSRSSSVMAAVTSGGQSGLLAMLMHKSVASILQQANVPLAPSGSGVLPAAVVAAAQAGGASSSGAVAAGVEAAAAAAPALGSVQYSVAFVDALLALVAALVTSSSGCQALNDAGVISALLPLLRDHHPDHLTLVCTSLKILEMYMDLSQTASTSFRDLGGLSGVIKRLAREVDAVAGTPSTAAPEAAAAAATTMEDTDVEMAAMEQPAGQTSTSSTDQAALGAPTAMKQLPHNRKSLLKILLRIITISSYQPTGNLSATRPVDDDAQLLYASLKAMYSRAEEFGGTLFSHAVSVMTDLIHHEPQSFRQLQEAGLPDAFLDAVKGGVFPSGDAICAFPGALVALCLNSTGLRRVREAAALNVLVDIFVSKKSMRMLTGDTPSVLGSGLEELMRFVPSLRSDGVDVVLGVFKALCILGGDEGERFEASTALVAEAPQQLSAAAVEPAQAANPGAEAGADAGTPGSSTAPLAAVQPMETDTAAAPSAAVEQLGAGAAGAGAGAGPAGGTEALADEMDVDVRQEQAATAEQSAAVPQVEPTPAPAALAAATQATPPEHEHSRQLQQAEDARLSATARRVLAQSLHQVAAKHDLEEDIEAFLPLALTAASRMLEPLLANAETSRLFVERGGADLLLKLYKLPRLTTVFNFSSASHSLLSVFRALSGAHGSAIAAKSKEAVAQQLAQLLPMAEAVGPVCVPILPADVRDKYVKQVLVVQGLVALTSAVARNVTAMLPQVSMGDPPLLANMGKLERIVMAQAAASDPWKQARDAAKRAAAAVEASGVAAAVDVHAQVNMEAGPGVDAAAGAMDLAAAAAGDNDVMEGPSAEQEPDRVLPEGGGSAPGLVAGNGKHKRTPEDTSYDALSYLLTSLRTFYMGTAKAIHTPVRRREEAAAAPTAPMKAAALNLALLLVGNLSLRPWCQQQQSSKALDAAALQASSPEGGSNTSNSVQQELNAAVAAVRSRSGHFLRVVDELSQVLFDSRRHYCHLLVLNYFSALGGMQVYASVVSDAAVLMWELLDLQQEAAKAGQQAATGDQAVATTQHGSVTSAGAAPSASLEVPVTAAAAGVASGTAGTKDPKQIMEAVLVKMLVIYEQLANATVLLSAPQATHMLLAALPNYAGQPLVPPAKDALQFIQQLHGHIMCAVLPLWSNPKIADAPPGVLGAVIRVLQTCCQGPGHASLLLRYTQRPAAARIQTQPDPQMVQQITEMGFSQPRAEEALRRVGANSVELAMEWLITHPEERAAPAGGQAAAAAATGAAALHAAVTEEEELTRALLASLSVVGMSPDAVAQRSHQELASQADASEAVVQEAATSDQQQVAETPETTPRSFAPPNAPVLGGVAAAAAVVGTAVSGPTTAGAAASGADAIGIPAPSQLVDGALRLISASPATTFPIADLVLTIAQREDGKDREALLERLINDCLPPAADMASTSTAQQTAPGANALTPARLLLLLLHKDPASRRLAATKGIVDRCLKVLEAWQSQNAAAIERYESLDVEKQRDEQEVKHLEVPVWVEAVFLLLDLTVTTQPKSATAPAARATREAARAAAITVASGTLTSAVDAAASAAGGLEQPSDQQAAASDIQMMAQQPAPAGTGADAALPQQAAAPSPMSGDVPLPPELAQLPGLKQLLANWRPCGMLDEHQQERATAISLTMLQRLHKYANKWDNPNSSMFEAEGSLPNPGSATSVVLQLLSHLTRRHNNAQRVLAAAGHKLLLSLPSACLSPSASRQEGHIGAIFRHLLEDPITLEAWMESEIKNSMSVKGVRDPYPYARSFNQANPLSRYTTAASFLTMMSSLVSRDPAVFLQAVARTCTLETTRGETMVRLKTPREQQQQQQTIASVAVGRDHANALAAVLPKPVAAAAAAPELGVTAGTPPPAAPSRAGGSADTTGPAAAAVLTCDTAAAKSVEHNLSKPASRSSRKLVPSNFVEVVDALLDVVLSYKGIKAVQAAQPQQQQQHNTPEAAAMEVDAGPVNADGRASVADPPAAQPAVVGSLGTAPLPADLLLRKLSPVMHEVGIQVIVLRLLADYCLLYNNTVGLLLKRDSDCGPVDGRSALLLHHHHHHPAGGAAQHTLGQEGSEGSKTVVKSRTARHTSVSSSGGSGGGTGRSGMPGTAAAGQAGQDHRAGSVLKHIMNVQLVDPPSEGIQAGAGVAANASALLQAVCIRSGEGRKRILAEMVRVLASGADQVDKETGSSIPAGKLTPSLPYLCQPGGPEPVKVAAYLGLLGALVQSSSSPGMPRSDPRQPSSSTSMPFELLRAMREAGVVKAVAGVLKLVDTNHAKAKDAISAILKPLEVLTRPLPKQLAATDGAAQQELRGILEQAARQPASDAAAVASARVHPPQTMPAAATGSTHTGPAAAGGSPAAGQPQAGSGDAGVGHSSGELFSSGARAAVDEDQRQQAGEAAAGPNALAAAGRFVAGGAGQAAQPLSGGLIDHLMEQLVDIEVELGAGEDDDGDGSSDDEGSSDGDSRSDEGDEGSDEDMAEREEHEDGIEGHAAAGGSDEGVMGDAPSLTEGGEDSDEQEAHGQLILGDAGVNAGLSAAAIHDPEAHNMADINSSEEEPESDDDPDHHLQHHHHHFQDALLPEDEMHLLPPQLQGAHHGQDGVVDPLDDEEEEEEEDEYLDDDDDERSDDEEGRFDIDITTDEFINGEARFSWEMPIMPGEADNVPPALMMPGTFGRAAARRMLYRPAAATTAAGVWDDSEPGDAAQDPLNGVATMQMLLSQFGINANGASSVAMIGPNGRQYRMALLSPDGTDLAGSGRASSGAMAGAMNGALYSISMQLMPQQHRLLALPPRVPVSDSAALLESAGGAVPMGSPATAAAADADVGMRGNATSANALTRLLARTPEGAGVTSYLRDGARARLATQRQGGLFSVALDPAGVPATLGPAANLLQSVNLLQPGALLSGAPGAGTLADVDNSVWDEAVNQLLEALAPQGLGRARTAAAASGSARAGAAAEDAAIDPRFLESQMLALLRAQAPRQPPNNEQQQQELQAAPEERHEQAGAPHTQAAAGMAAPDSSPDAADAPADAQVPAATEPHAGARATTQQVLAAAIRAAMQDEPATRADGGALAQHQLPAAAALPQQQPRAQQQQQEQAAAISSHPVEVGSSAPDSPAAGATSVGPDQSAPMDIEEAAPQVPAAPAAAVATAAAAAVQGEAAAAGGAAAMEIEGANPGEQEALRQAAEAAEVDLTFLEALPEELRVEVLSARGVELRLPQPQAALQPQATAAAVQVEPPASATAHLAAEEEGHTPAAAVVAPAAEGDAPDTAGPPAASGTAEAAAEGAEASIDPEFLAALPEDIRQEVLAQQAAERRARAATRAAQQRQQEMGLADLLAAMDDDARADALGQLQDSDLAQLPPMMRAQAQALRERVARQQQALQQQQAAMAAQQQQQQHDFILRRAQLGSGSLGGIMGGAANRLLMPMGPDGLPLVVGASNRFGPLAAGLGSGVRTDAARAELLEAAGQVAEESEGPPLLDETELDVLVHLLQVSLPLSKVHLQKLLLNLAGHSITREQLLRKLLGLLRALPGSSLEDSAAAEEQEKGTGSRSSASMDTSDGTSGQLSQQHGLTATLDVLGAAVVSPLDRGANAAAEGSSGLVVFGCQGKPAIISRRVLDMLAYLSRHSQLVARQMLQLRIPDLKPARQHDDKGKSAAAVAATAEAAAAPLAVEVLFAMLSAPLCQRSISLLEQLSLLLEVVLSMVQRYEADMSALAAMREARKKQQEEEQSRIKALEQQQASDSGQAQQQQAAAAIDRPGASSALHQNSEHVKAQGVQLQPQSELASALASIAPGLLQQLPGLLAREALSESAYVSIAKIIKLIVESAPVHLPLMLAMLVDGVSGVATRLLALLDTAAANGIDADAQLAPAIGTKGGVVLRMLYALQGFQTEVRVLVKQQEQQHQPQQPQEAGEERQATTAAGDTTPASSSAATPAMMSGDDIRPAAASSNSAAGSSAAASMVTSLDPVAALSEVDKAVASVVSRTSPLWKALSSCILRVEDNLRAVLPHTHIAGESAGHAAARLLPPGAQQVLPLVEAFFVLCALQGAIPAAPSVGKDLLTAPSAEMSMLGGPVAATAAASGSGGSTGRAINPTPSAASQLKRGSSAALDAANSVEGCLSFIKFAEWHRRLLNAYIRRNTSLLESSLAPLLGLPKLIDFDNKRAYFKSKVRAQEDRTYAGGLRLAVKRSTVFEDSFNKLRSRTPAEMRGKLSVSFIGEEGIDAGGVSREWYQVMAREIFNPNLALFVSVPEGGTTFQPNPNSVVQSDTGVSHLEFFKFVGRLVGKALYDGQLMDAHFTRSFYKHMLGQPLTYEDIEAVDPEYYKNLKWMLENDITDVLDLTFTAESDFFGKTEIVELIPGGREVKVTEANKHEYVNLIARHRMTTSIKAQIQGFLEGFWQLVPRDLICIFNDHELELLISGLPDIDVADLRANTEYTGYSAGSPVIQWFWQVVSEMDKQDLALLLQFVTGTSKVPLGGFKSLQGISGPQRFQIHKSYGANRLPSAHTCFNQLDLPEYESKEQLAERLAVAVHEGHEGFGFG